MNSNGENALGREHIIACVWDFDKTLIKGYMETPIFEEYAVDEKLFWREVNMLPKLYAERGVRVSPDTVYLNHLLSYVKSGAMAGLGNAKLRSLGARLELCDGLPGFFAELRREAESFDCGGKADIRLEHYVVSTGLAEMIRGSKIAGYVDGVFGCEFIEEPLPPFFSIQTGFEAESPSPQLGQIGMMVDNTMKTRFVFEINKGANKNSGIDVNSSISEADRRVPMRNMIYVADGPSDVPAFSVVRNCGGKAFAVHTPGSDGEIEQNDTLLREGRIDMYGPNVYTPESITSKWLKMHVRKICERIVREVDAAVESRVGKPPSHLHPPLKDAHPGVEPTLF